MEKKNLENNCDINDIEAWHILRGDETIVTFCKRKICQNALRKKRSSKKVEPSNIGLRGKTPLLITESLCYYYKGLWNKCNKLWRVCGINVKNCETKNLYILTSLSMAISSTI